MRVFPASGAYLPLKLYVITKHETLQPDQASLKEPGPETKKLARTAKDSNRLDVFEHLREITPAGTAGEFGIVMS